MLDDCESWEFHNRPTPSLVSILLAWDKCGLSFALGGSELDVVELNRIDFKSCNVVVEREQMLMLVEEAVCADAIDGLFWKTQSNRFDASVRNSVFLDQMTT